ALGLQRQAGQIRPRARLGIALAPPHVSGEDLRQVLGLLLRRAEGHDHWGAHLQAHVRGRGGAGERHLHLENIFLGLAPTRAAVFDWPVWRDPALRAEPLQPADLRLLVEIAVLRLGQLGPHAVVERLGDEGADLVAEFQILRREVEVHGGQSTVVSRSISGRPASTAPSFGPAALKCSAWPWAAIASASL